MLGLCLLASVAAVALPGCTGPITPVQDGIALPDYPQVLVDSYWLEQNIRVQPPVASRVGNGQLKVQIPVRTHTDYSLSLDYQFTFLDQNGLEVEKPGWQYIRIPRKGMADITCTSMTPAADFRVMIRYRK
jgi:uncharacterized protein YcfL